MSDNDTPPPDNPQSSPLHRYASEELLTDPMGLEDLALLSDPDVDLILEDPQHQEDHASSCPLGAEDTPNLIPQTDRVRSRSGPFDGEAVLENSMGIDAASGEASAGSTPGTLVVTIPGIPEPTSSKHSVSSNSSSPVPVVIEIDVEIEQRPLPSGFEKKIEHPFHNLYSTNREALPDDPAQRIAAQMTLQDVLEFRNNSIDSARIINIPTPCPIQVNAPSDLVGIETRPKESGAIYVLEEHNGRSWVATPLHVEVVANDRPDLFKVVLDPFAVDLANLAVIPHFANFYPGDAIYVTDLIPKPNATSADIVTTMDSVRQNQNHRFWKVKTFYLISRTFQRDVLTTRGTQGASRGGRVQCITAGLHIPTTARAAQYTAINMESLPGAKTRATIFLPQLQPGQHLRSVKQTGEQFTVAWETSAHAALNSIPPQIAKMDSLDEETLEMVTTAEPLFRRYSTDPERALEALLMRTHLGFSGVLAMANKNRDLRFHPTSIEEITWVQGRPVVSFRLTNRSGPLKIGQWLRSTPITLHTNNNRSVTMEVESSLFTDHRISVSAKPSSNRSDITEFIGTLGGAQVIISQKIEDSSKRLKMFPTLGSYLSLTPDAPIRRILSTAFGGPRIPETRIPHASIQLHMGDVVPSEEQAKFINAIAETGMPVVIANSPFGVGKTLMIAGAANVVARKRGPERTHMAIATTNAAVAALVSTFLKIHSDFRQPAVRVISQANQESIDEQVRTPLDFSTLSPKVFRQHVLGEDRSLPKNSTPSMLTSCMVRHLKRARHLERSELQHPVLVKDFASDSRPTISLHETFLDVYKPRIFFGTAASTELSLRNDLLRHVADQVDTIQIDEASQFPIHALINIGPLVPSARYALIGDIQQLKPYSDLELPADLKNSSVGNILQSLTEARVQTVNITAVRRCPPQITALCSKNFYPRELTSTRSAQRSNRFAEFLRLKGKSPIHVINTNGFASHVPSGTSLFSPKEADLATVLVETLLNRRTTGTIGVLSFYKAQAGVLARKIHGEQVFTGTIDASQGKEFDVNILLTTRTSPFSSKQAGAEETEFITDPQRVNVALSRTKELCVVIADLKMARRSRLWSSILHDVPPTAFHSAAEVLRQCQQ